LSVINFHCEIKPANSLQYYAKKTNFDGRVGYALHPPSPPIVLLFENVIPVPKGHTTKPQVGKEEYVHSFLTQRRLVVSESFKACSWAFHLL
jgi:hypothetical protein